MGMTSLITEGAASGSTDGLFASAITGIVTIVITLMGIFATRIKFRNRDPKEDPPVPDVSDPVAVAEIKDLKRQRDTLQRKYDDKVKEAEIYQRLLWQNHINPYTGERT